MLRFCPELMYIPPILQRNAVPMRFRRYKPVEFPVLEKSKHSRGYGTAPVSSAYWNMSSYDPSPDVFVNWANGEGLKYKNGVWSRPRALKDLLSLQREYNKRKSLSIEEEADDLLRRKEWVVKEDAMLRDFMVASSTNWEEIGRFPVLQDLTDKQLKKQYEQLFNYCDAFVKSEAEKHFERVLMEGASFIPKLETIKQVAKPGELPPNWGKVL